MFSFEETISYGYAAETLDILSLLSLYAGIAVITTKNPIEALLNLILLFAFIAVYLILIGLDFIGFSYLIVYIGAVSILFIFILMLINIRSSELQSNNLNSIALGLFLILLLNYILSEDLPYYFTDLNNNTFSDIIKLILTSIKESIQSSSSNLWMKHQGIYSIISNHWDSNIIENSNISAIGNILYTSYNIWLFMSSLILLLAMVGAIVITINKK